MADVDLDVDPAIAQFTTLDASLPSGIWTDPSIITITTSTAFDLETEHLMSSATITRDSRSIAKFSAFGVLDVPPAIEPVPDIFADL